VKKLIIVAVVVVGGLFLMEQMFEQQPDKRNYEYAPDMARTFAYKAQQVNPHFASGQTPQPPVAGTIARGYMPIPFGPSLEEAKRAGEELTSPFDEQHPADLKRGEAVFQTFCRPCHGAGGKGDGVVTRRGFPPPPSLLLPHARDIKDGQIFHIITFGFKNMPSHGSQVSRMDRWQAVAYVRKLQETQP